MAPTGSAIPPGVFLQPIQSYSRYLAIFIALMFSLPCPAVVAGGRLRHRYVSVATDSSIEVIGYGPFSSSATKVPEGMRYYLGKDTLVVTTTLREKIATAATGANLDIRASVSAIASDAQIELATVADRSQFCVLATSGACPARGFSIRLSEDGQLRFLNYPLATLDRGFRSVCDVSIMLDLNRPTSVSPSTVKMIWDNTTAAQTLTGVQYIKAFKRFAQLEEVMLAFFRDRHVADDLWSEKQRLEQSITERLKARSDLLDAAAHGHDAYELEMATKKAAVIDSDVMSLRQSLEIVSKRFDTALAEYTMTNGIGKPTEQVRTVKWTFELEELPSSSILETAHTAADVVNSLQGSYPEMLAMFRETNLVCALDVRGPAQVPQPPSNPLCRSRICVRDPDTAIVTTFGYWVVRMLLL